jgi:hypothetical protein
MLNTLPIINGAGPSALQKRAHNWTHTDQAEAAMSSAAAAPKPAAAAEEPEEGPDGSQPRLRVTLRLADIIQLTLVIGRSRFGEVKLAKNRQTDDIYALKALRKSKYGALLQRLRQYVSCLLQRARAV